EFRRVLFRSFGQTRRSRSGVEMALSDRRTVRYGSSHTEGAVIPVISLQRLRTLLPLRRRHSLTLLHLMPHMFPSSRVIPPQNGSQQTPAWIAGLPCTLYRFRSPILSSHPPALIF